MRKKGFIRTILDAIRDTNRLFTERVFLTLTLVSLVPLFIAIIADIYTGENPVEIVTLIITLIFIPIFVFFCLKFNKLDFAKKYIVLMLVFVLVPILYFFGGGLEGGGVFWIIYTFIYVGLVLTGCWRRVTLALLALVTTILYGVTYFRPELIKDHTKEMTLIDTYLSVVLVGMICCIMTWIQRQFYAGESNRAKEAAEKAEELTKAQNRFFSSMSHEIRTPINSILGLNELILRDQGASDEIVRDAMGIQGSGKMLLALINDILDFSKMEAGSMEIVPVDYRVGDMLSEIVNMIWIRANDKGLKLNVTIDPKVPSVLYGDEVRIKQIIINLLNNAVKYTAHGSVELHVESEAKDEKTVDLHISVSDTGIGIKKEALPYLFDAFKRVDEEKNRHIEGTGLGLSIVKQLVELMGGTITVNSVYGEGSIFTFVISQGISNTAPIGELNIHNQSVVNRKTYECGFRAPEARILIVDDNEMNLEVESKLLTDTGMVIRTAESGQEALEYSLKERFDVILMDHLMPEMDGIECLRRLREQIGGLNRTTPVIVLTANAGSENRDMYKRSGFDGYLVKPVSGEGLENILMKYISVDKIMINSNKLMTAHEEINAATGYSGKIPVIITSTSMCDLPESLTKKFIPLLPFLIKTEEGVFKDGIQMAADELISYIASGKNAESMPPDETAYRDFFASELRHAHHVIHIAITTGMSDDYNIALEASKAFDNVTVVNSETVSSATGILVLIAIKLAQINMSPEEIVKELDEVKRYLRCSFVLDNTDYMSKKSLISATIDDFVRALNLHPCIRIKNGMTGLGGIWFGSRKRAYRKFIARALPAVVTPDSAVVFVTYVDVPIDTLMWVKEEIEKRANFDNIIFVQASAAISSNCGPGSFGILYLEKMEKDYNLGVFVDKKMSILEDGAEADQASEEQEEEVYDIIDYKGNYMLSDTTEHKWYDDLKGIDGETAIEYSGSEESFRLVLKIFYDSIDDKARELNSYFENEDWKNYIIKVHAIKSSAKLMGAIKTSEEARLLEDAGKAGNIDFIRGNHGAFISGYTGFKAILAPLFEEESKEKASEDNKPKADKYLMEGVYEGLLEAAKAMNCDAIEEILKEIGDYTIPDDERERLDALREMAGKFDYDSIVTELTRG